MKKKNGMKVALASTVMLLMASPAFAQKYKVAKVERTRILVDQKWDAQPDAEATRFIAPYKSKVDSIMGPVVGHIAHDMTRHVRRANSVTCSVTSWYGVASGLKNSLFSLFTIWVASVLILPRVRLL